MTKKTPQDFYSGANQMRGAIKHKVREAAEALREADPGLGAALDALYQEIDRTAVHPFDDKSEAQPLLGTSWRWADEPNSDFQIIQVVPDAAGEFLVLFYGVTSSHADVSAIRYSAFREAIERGSATQA